MHIKFLKYFPMIFVLAVYGCAGNISKQNNLKLNIEIVKLNAWINLMPGQTNLFYLSGNLRIRNIKNEFLNDLQLSEVRLLQNDKIVHVIKPVFYADNGSAHIAPGEEKFFTLKTAGGLKIINKLNMDSPLDLQLKFVNEKSTYIFKISSIKIEKVY